MTHENRGKCIIFNHERFESLGFDKREGSSLDAQRLEKTFEKLGFDVELYVDFTHSEVMTKIDEGKKRYPSHFISFWSFVSLFIKFRLCIFLKFQRSIVHVTVSQLDHTKNDCLCIITLTHGIQNDMICAKDVAYKSDKLWEPFAADKCITLAGKPKLFFIQVKQLTLSEFSVLFLNYRHIPIYSCLVLFYPARLHCLTFCLGLQRRQIR